MEDRLESSQEELCVAVTGALRARDSLGDLVRDWHCGKAAENISVGGRRLGNESEGQETH